MNDTEKAEALGRSALGTELSDAQCQVLAAQMGVVELHHGDKLVTEGEQRRTLFVLVKGRINVCKQVGGQEETVYQMREGECAGTRAFVDGSPRKAMLCSDGDSTLLTLDPEPFEALIDRHPHTVHKVMRAIFRITHTNLMRVNLESAEMRNYLSRSGGRY